MDYRRCLGQKLHVVCKAEAAAEHLFAFPCKHFELLNVILTQFPERRVINRLCPIHGILWVSAGQYGIVLGERQGGFIPQQSR